MTTTLESSSGDTEPGLPSTHDLFDDITIGLALLDLEGRILRVNETFCGVFDQSPEELISRQWSDFVTSDDAGTQSCLTRVATGLDTRATYLEWIQHANGEVVETRVTVSISSVGGRRVLLVELGDHSELREAMTLLFDSERRFNAVAKCSTDIIVWISFEPEVRVRFVSDSVCEVTGYSADDLYAFPELLRQIIHPDDFPLLLEFLHGGTDAGGVLLRWITREGSVVWVELRCSLLANDLGVISEMLCVCHDVTDRIEDQHAEEDRAHLAAQLRDAIHRGSILAHFQPIVNARTGLVTGYEALARWQRNDETFVAPYDFIPLAEGTGDIVTLGRSIIEQSCDFLSQLRQRGALQDLNVSVNVSALQLQDRGFTQIVESTLTRHGVAPTELCLELTESLLIVDNPQIIETLCALKELGVRLAIDDFGTGFSSFAYLTQLPVDVLKLDRALVSDIDSDERKRAVVATLVTMADTLGLTIIAEGVETTAERDVLTSQGISLAQGYLWGRAVPQSTALADAIALQVLAKESVEMYERVLEEKALMTVVNVAPVDVPPPVTSSSTRWYQVNPASRAVRWYLIFGLALVVLYHFNPHPSVLPSWSLRFPLYLAVNASAVVGIVYGIRRWKPDYALPWWLMALGQAVYTVGDFLYYWGRDVTHVLHYPGLADLFYIGRVPFVILALALIIHRRSGHNRLALLDSLIVGVAVSVVSWVFLMEPYTRAHMGMTAILTSLAYPITDLMLLVMAVRLLAGGGRRAPSFFFLTGGLVLLAMVDSVYGWTSLHGGVYGAGSMVEIGWLLFYLSVGASGLHPSMKDLTSPVETQRESYSRLRIAVLGLAAMAGPSLTAFEYLSGRWHHDLPIVLGSIAVIGLITVRLSEVMHRQRIADAEIRHQAFHDPLTGLANRSLFDDRLSHALERSRRDANGLAFILVDLDGFKNVNDTLGHAAGDELLSLVATRLRACSRVPDSVARLGGDEFALLIENLHSIDGAAVVAQRITQAMSEPTFLRGSAVDVSASVGLAYAVSGTLDADELYHQADRAMYDAKRESVGGWRVFDPVLV